MHRPPVKKRIAMNARMKRTELAQKMGTERAAQGENQRILKEIFRL
jgi:hypothetical protein